MIDIRGPLLASGNQEVGTAFFFAHVDTQENAGRMAVMYSSKKIVIGTLWVEEMVRKRGVARLLIEAAYRWAQIRKVALYSGAITSQEVYKYWEGLEKAGMALREQVDRDEMFVRGLKGCLF